MTKKKTKRSCLYETCPYDDASLAISEKSSVFAHLGARAIYVGLTWFLIGNVMPGQSFFSGAFLISLSMILSYVQFMPKESVRKKVYRVGLISSFLWGAISLACMLSTNIDVGTGDIVFKNHVALKGITINLFWTWIVMGVTLAALPVIDWIAHVCIGEEQVITDLSKGVAP